MGIAGLDFVVVDGEHGLFSWENVDDICRTADLSGLTVIARAPNIEASTILRYLDRGVQGILGPGIDTKAQAQQLVDACFYAPLGKRGLGGAPRAAGFVNFADREYIEEANSQMFVAAFLEHPDAIENLDEILTVDGIHAYYVGPQDMSVSMGLPGQPDHPRVKEAAVRVKDAVSAVGRYYYEDLILADRATNFFLSGVKSFVESRGGQGSSRQ